MELFFVTSNKGKIASLERYFERYGRADFKIKGISLDIIEPQMDSVAEISKYKAERAYELLKAPIIVEDGGFSINVLNGFPGVYSKYFISTLGSDGILKLMAGETDRRASFISVTTYIDENGEVHQFNRSGGDFEISLEKKCVEHPEAWSDLWKIAYIKEFGKNLCELSKNELSEYLEKSNADGSLQHFAKWFLGER